MHDHTLVSAINAAIARVEYHLGADDTFMADVCGGTVRKLLSHPCACLYKADLTGRRMLKRWDAVRLRLGPAPIMLTDYAEHLAGVLLVEATRAAEREALAQ